MLYIFITYKKINFGPTKGKRNEFIPRRTGLIMKLQQGRAVSTELEHRQVSVEVSPLFVKRKENAFRLFNIYAATTISKRRIVYDTASVCIDKWYIYGALGDGESEM